jgi:hypothetical protein
VTWQGIGTFGCVPPVPRHGAPRPWTFSAPAAAARVRAWERRDVARHRHIRVRPSRATSRRLWALHVFRRRPPRRAPWPRGAVTWHIRGASLPRP